MMALGLVKKERQGTVQYNSENCIESEKDMSFIIDEVRSQLAASKVCTEFQKQKLWELLTQYVAIKKLMRRNDSDSSREQHKDRKIPLPFILIGISTSVNDLLGKDSEATIELSRKKTHFTVLSKRAFTVKDDNNFLSLLSLDTYYTITHSLNLEDAELLDGENLRDYFRKTLSPSTPSNSSLEEKSIPMYAEEEKGGIVECFNELTPLQGKTETKIVGLQSTPSQRLSRTALEAPQEVDAGYLLGENTVSPLKSVKTRLYGSRKPGDDCSN
eukprot:TRINITY_DN1516_c0_g6_i1.p1 TRINITY_DN1516_c0_g6~~TRINITY_DN1516_c0_g6_i1.p1  ORF type:complete len:272 (+),score=42.52 TRINITY_DN1516_c0_g6_i1:527-1342(+)